LLLHGDLLLLHGDLLLLHGDLLRGHLLGLSLFVEIGDALLLRVLLVLLLLLVGDGLDVVVGCVAWGRRGVHQDRRAGLLLGHVLVGHYFVWVDAFAVIDQLFEFVIGLTRV